MVKQMRIEGDIFHFLSPLIHILFLHNQNRQDLHIDKVQIQNHGQNQFFVLYKNKTFQNKKKNKTIRLECSLTRMQTAK